MRKYCEQTREVLARAMVDFEHLRALANQLEIIGEELAGDEVFLLAQIAGEIAQTAEARVIAELDQLEAARKKEVHHA
ncbi:hypothetical protein [Burkholderia sp. A9]|uniref:hypothetical protein n=1 Tax=Burkholderia sp. A9 TaxID=1365108 RepID=UPI00126A26C0|nr:hypothetical protein [Burkholderia sp. A9]